MYALKCKCMSRCQAKYEKILKNNDRLNGYQNRTSFLKIYNGSLETKVVVSTMNLCPT